MARKLQLFRRMKLVVFTLNRCAGAITGTGTIIGTTVTGAGITVTGDGITGIGVGIIGIGVGIITIGTTGIGENAP